MRVDPTKMTYITWGLILLIFCMQVVSDIYMRKKFNDNIVILQASEDQMNQRVQAILFQLQESQRNSPLKQGKPNQ